MAEGRIFVGRKDELRRWGEALADERGQAVIVAGQAGMGKTWLIDKMGEMAANHPELKCGWVRYEVTASDSVDVVMERMMEDAFRAGDVVEGSFDNTAVRRKQWYALLETVVPKGEKLSKLIQSFKREEKRPTREQFLERLGLVSGKMKGYVRAVFIVDPFEYLDRENEKKRAEDWAIVVRDLPDRVKLIFGQRPEDGLVRCRKFAGLKKVVRIPGMELGKLGKEAADKLVTLRASETEYGTGLLRESLGRYGEHPYALQGALDLLAGGSRLEELPDDPTATGVAEGQWERIRKGGEDAIALFEALAILEVPVPDEVVEAVAGVARKRREALIGGDVFLEKLIYGEVGSKRIYHELLARYILGQMGADEGRMYHRRAVEFYRARLKDARARKMRPDGLAAVRLAEHVLAAEGEQAFVQAFVNECFSALRNLGLLDAAIGLSGRALGVVEKGSKWEAMVLGNLGIVYRTRGELDKAEEMYRKAVEISEAKGMMVESATVYGNMGVIHKTRGELEKAEEMYRKALEISEAEGMVELTANQYGNLAIVYKKRGRLDEAEGMLVKALEIHKRLGKKDGEAQIYGNLGNVHQTRGELYKAEEMFRKGLAIDEKLGRLEGMAAKYGNLGNVYETRGELDKAEEVYKKSLEISEARGIKGLTANQYGNLGNVFRMRGELDKAEEMFRKGLAIDEKLGHLEGMAAKYGNFGNVFRMRGDLDKAEEMYRQGLAIDEKLGRLEGMAANYANLGIVYATRGDMGKAREYWEKSRGLYERIGAAHNAERVEALIRGLGEN